MMNRLILLTFQVATLKAQLAKANQPGGFAMLDDNGRVPQKLLPGGFDQYSAFDLGWQSLHMAAAAACRGSTASGGSGCCCRLQRKHRKWREWLLLPLAEEAPQVEGVAAAKTQ